MSTLTPGQRLGPYEVGVSLGAGGMGEVFLARDTRLDRTVAISREQFSERFDREARAVAALNHPNICTLYDVGPDYLVMEFIEGPTLADRLATGAIPVDEALRIARQIGDALEAAHEQGIVHRDLKPGNVKIKSDGLVKVLDFGLAKVGGAPVSQHSADSPTISMAATQAGVILGTAAYMAPEQARGKPVDKRADIWAFGVVLYEMVTGRQLFEGEDVTETLATVIKGEPKWDGIPANLQRLLKSCLEKDPKRRLRDIGDAWRLLEEAPSVTAPSRSRLGIGASVVAAVAVVVASVLAFVHFREKPPAAEVVRFQIYPPENRSFVGTDALLSPDGRRIVFHAANNGQIQVWVRSLDSLEARPLAGTGDIVGSSFWSPDSRFLGFAAQGKLKKVDVSGGSPQTVCDVPGSWRGGAWSRHGVIIFGVQDSGLWRVSEAGGTPSQISRVDPSRQETLHSGPDFLPDGRHFLYFRGGREIAGGISLGSIDSKPEQQSASGLSVNGTNLISGATPAFAPPSPNSSEHGHLLFLRENSLMAQALDVRRFELVGEAVPIADGFSGTAGARRFSASATGALAYRTVRGGGAAQPFWFDRDGKTLGTAGEPGRYGSVALSPDGTRVAVSHSEQDTGGRPPFDLWIHEFSRDTSERLTSTRGFDWFATWSADGKQIIFSSERDGGINNLYRRVSNGAGKDELILKSDQHKLALDWSRDGRFLLYSAIVSVRPDVRETSGDLWVLPLAPGNPGDAKPQPYLTTEFNEGQGRFSPDGRFVAYRSDASGKDEIYVQPFPVASGGRVKVSQGGGYAPVWRADGKELFYISADSKMMAVEVSSSPVFKAGIPKTLFQTSILATPWGVSRTDTRYDVTSDGKKFLINSILNQTALPPAPITVILNWQALLKK